LAKDKNVSVLDSVLFLHGKQLLQKFTRVSLRYKIKAKQTKEELKKPADWGYKPMKQKTSLNDQ